MERFRANLSAIHSTPIQRGEWRLWQGRVLLSCPECGILADLQQHEIRPGGLVEPSVICPGVRCGFHRMVTLVDWGQVTKAAAV